MDRLTKRGAISQRDINMLMDYSDDNQFGRNDAYYKLQYYEDLEEQKVQAEHTCEYCHTPFKHCGQYYIATGLNNDPYLHLIRKEDSIGGAMIKYCPWCGRELDPWY